MLRDLCAVFATFADSQEFHLHCANSGYYNSILVAKAVKTCVQKQLLMGEEMERFQKLPGLLEAASSSISREDSIFAEAPDDFLDPLLMTYMKDPVYLPTSDTVVDRSTITQHLLNDPTDPFNRKELTVDMIKPATELKERMNKWLEEKRAARDQN